MRRRPRGYRDVIDATLDGDDTALDDREQRDLVRAFEAQCASTRRSLAVALSLSALGIAWAMLARAMGGDHAGAVSAALAGAGAAALASGTRDGTAATLARMGLGVGALACAIEVGVEGAHGGWGVARALAPSAFAMVCSMAIETQRAHARAVDELRRLEYRHEKI